MEHLLPASSGLHRSRNKAGGAAAECQELLGTRETAQDMQSPRSALGPRSRPPRNARDPSEG
eukprot:9501874-Pyramimonas_sp.AAC.1